MSDHKRRFKRWHTRSTGNTRFLVDLILTEIVPCFEQQGFVWYSDFAGGDIQQVANSSIPLQRREGEFWPTVEISFDQRNRPAFSVNFAVLPPNCRRWTANGWADVAQAEAALVDGIAVFYLHGSSRWSQNGFGYRYFSLLPKRRLKRDVAQLAERLPGLFRLLDSRELEMKAETADSNSAFGLLFVVQNKYN